MRFLRVGGVPARGGSGGHWVSVVPVKFVKTKICFGSTAEQCELSRQHDFPF